MMDEFLSVFIVNGFKDLDIIACVKGLKSLEWSICLSVDVFGYIVIDIELFEVFGGPKLVIIF